LGTFSCPKKFNKSKVKIVIRNEAIMLYSDKKNISKNTNKNKYIISPYIGCVMEARLLAGSTLVHLSIKVGNTDFHVHARIPGLNFFNINEKVKVCSDPSQIFIFKD